MFLHHFPSSPVLSDHCQDPDSKVALLAAFVSVQLGEKKNYLQVEWTDGHDKLFVDNSQN